MMAGATPVIMEAVAAAVEPGVAAAAVSKESLTAATWPGKVHLIEGAYRPRELALASLSASLTGGRNFVFFPMDRAVPKPARAMSALAKVLAGVKTAASVRSYLSLRSTSYCNVILEPTGSKPRRKLVASAPRHSTGLLGSFVSGVSMFNSRMISFLPCTEATRVSPSVMDTTVPVSEPSLLQAETLNTIALATAMQTSDLLRENLAVAAIKNQHLNMRKSPLLGSANVYSIRMRFML